MTDLLDGLSDAERDAVKETAQPDWTAPMLATLHDEPFSDPGWIFERKLDGVRLLAFRQDGQARLMSRNRNDRSATWFEIRDALEDQNAQDCVVDGEVVAFSGNVSSFRRLQGRMQVQSEEDARERAETVKVHFYAFDLLHVGGFDVTGLPLRRRKSLLRRVLSFHDPLHFMPHRNETGEAFLAEACERGWEGLIAKRADSAYVHNRSTDWLKLKCSHRQELVVGGFTEPEGSRKGFGAILVGYHEAGGLRYAGKVGTGWDDESLVELRARMDRLERKTSPFEGGDDLPEKDVHWVTPKLVAEIGFTEWTDDGKLRHPRFLGLRTDKDPEDVVRERPGGRDASSGSRGNAGGER
ncbi:MAG: non-homologous end-joining DNA ligase [bacterium]